MIPPDENRSNTELLRGMAEADLARRPGDAGPTHSTEALLHELQVHQIELEMQNESLHQAQAALEEMRDHYADLYDLAPVGYLTLDADGMIEEVNLAAAMLLGMERGQLVHHSMQTRVSAEDTPRWTALFMRLLAGEAKGSAELAMRRGDGTAVQMQLDCVRRRPARVGAGATAILVVLQDISRRNAADAAQQQQISDLERFNRVAVDRELAMIELKRQLNALSCELGRPPPFALHFATEVSAGCHTRTETGAVPSGTSQ
jgi:PAS domain S-box-containing protein